MGERKLKKIVIIFLFLAFLTSCSQKETYEYKQINSQEALKVMEDNNYQIVDVRSKSEYNLGHIKDAININVENIETIDISKDTILFVYCASGTRSKKAAQKLLEMGYQVYDLGALENITLERE